jgi:hypothetical protein
MTNASHINSAVTGLFQDIHDLYGFQVKNPAFSDPLFAYPHKSGRFPKARAAAARLERTLEGSR